MSRDSPSSKELINLRISSLANFMVATVSLVILISSSIAFCAPRRRYWPHNSIWLMFSQSLCFFARMLHKRCWQRWYRARRLPAEVSKLLGSTRAVRRLNDTICIKEQCLTIRRSMRYDSVRKKTQIGPTKRKKIRTVDFCDTLAAILREAKKEQMLNSIKYGPLYSKTTIASSRKRTAPTTRSIPCPGQRHPRKITPRFPSSACGPMELMKPRQRSAAYADNSRKKIGDMDDFHFHLLRHTYTTQPSLSRSRTQGCAGAAGTF